MNIIKSFAAKQVLTDTSMNNIKDNLNAVASSTTVSTLSNIPIVNSHIVFATVSSDQQFSLSGIPSAGQEIHIIVKNSGTSTITVTIPNTSNTSYVNTTDNTEDTLSIDAGCYGEINCISDGSKIYIKIS